MGNVFSDVCDPLLVLPFLCGKGENLHNLEDNLEALQKEMQEVNAMMNHQLKKASKEGGRLVPEVSMWISTVEVTEAEVDRLLDGSISVIQRMSMYGYCSSRFFESECSYSENVKLTLENAYVRAVALWIASDYGRQKELVVVKWGERIKEMPVVDDWRTVTRMSVSSTQIENISDSPPNCSQLRTLFLQGNDNLRSISGCFFKGMTNLVVLDMSHNRELSVLPEEVSSLVSLQVLNLSWTSIECLPTGLRDLLGLVHLDLEHTRELKEFAFQVILGLSNLKTLRLFESFPMDHLNVELLQCFESLEELSLTVTRGSVLAHLLSNQRLASCTRRLSISGIEITKGATTLLRVLCSLRELDITSCSIEDSPMNWRRRSNVDEIPRFRHLGRVSFDGCGGLRDLTWLLNAPCLWDLSLNMCLDTKEIISKEKAMDQLGRHNTREQHPFQNLTKLSLTGLPQLESIHWSPLSFPVLEMVIISHCPSLKRLPFNSDNTRGNQFEVCLEEEWMKGVEWEDEIIKEHFTTLNNSYSKLFFSDCGS